MSENLSESELVGLCLCCQHVKLVGTDRGAVFYQCQRSGTDPGYPKYPRLPVLYCPGYEAKEEQ